MTTNGARTRLTREQRHLLLKSLICAQMNDEWVLLDEPQGLQQYGPPFINNGVTAPKEVGSQSEMYPEHTRKPIILLHLFHVHLRRFPGLKTAKVGYWQKSIVPFFQKISEAVFSNCQERHEYTNRRLLALVGTRYISTFFSRGVGLRGEGETRGPGRGEEGSDKWGVGKQWGKGTVKRGLERPVRPSPGDLADVQGLFQDQGDDSIVWKSANENVTQVKRDWSAWKESIIESEGGLEKTLELLQTKSLNNLPSEYRNATIWVRIHVATLLWTVFVQYPGGDEILGIIKTIHSLFPYWGAKQLLKIANAQKMIKAIIDLVLARPIGMVDSLGQRIFFIILNGEISYINKTFLSPLRKEIQNDKLCAVIDDYVKKRTHEQRSTLLQGARTEEQDCLVGILKEYGYDNLEEIQSWQQEYLASPYRSHTDWAYPVSAFEAKKMTSDKAPPPDLHAQSAKGALKFAQLKLYLRERLRRRDREKVLELGSGPLVPNIIKESLEVIFYKLIYQIALASDLSSRLGDLQRFVDDLIRTKNKKEEQLEDWIALCARHENSLYIFVHEIRDAIKPVWDWCQEALDFMALSTTQPWNLSSGSRKGISNIEVDLDQMLQDAARSGDVDADAIFEELDSLQRYSKWYKIEQQVQMQKDYVNIRQDSITSGTKMPRKKGSSDTHITPSNAMKRSLEEQGALMQIILEKQGVKRDDGIVRTKSRGTEQGELPWGFFAADDPLHQHYGASSTPSSTSHVAPLQYSVDGKNTPAPPSIPHIRSLLPAFRKALQRKIPDWTAKATC